jgi:hypothetical protein
LVNSGIEGFVRAAALEAPRRITPETIRVQVVPASAQHVQEK